MPGYVVQQGRVRGILPTNSVRRCDQHWQLRHCSCSGKSSAGGDSRGGGTSCTSQWVSVMVHESVVEGAPGMCGSEPVLFNRHRCSSHFQDLETSRRFV